mgnify:CR=1 FL=1
MTALSRCREGLRSIFAMRLLPGCRFDAGLICLVLMVAFVCLPAQADETCPGK